MVRHFVVAFDRPDNVTLGGKKRLVNLAMEGLKHARPGTSVTCNGGRLAEARHKKIKTKKDAGCIGAEHGSMLRMFCV